MTASIPLLPTHIREILTAITAAARSRELDAVRTVSGAGVHSAVVELSTHGREIVEWASGLLEEDRIPFIQALAAFEDTVGGIGSVTALRWLVRSPLDPNREALAWILAHTNAYSYYSHGAKSLEALDATEASAAAYRRNRTETITRRDAETRERVVDTATQRLPNAVRRGDRLAVEALLRGGADPSRISVDGKSLVETAREAGREDIAALLESQQAT